jgi:hypothetical protein
MLGAVFDFVQDFWKKYLSFLIGVKKGSFRISQSVPFIFAPPEHTDEMQCTIFYSQTVYMSVTQSCRP